MGGSLYKHDWLRDKIYNHPDIIGVDPSNVVSKSKEHCLMYKGHPLTIPDVVFYTPQSNYFTEVKSSNNHKLYSKGMSQLEKIAFWHEFNGIEQPQLIMAMPRRRNDTIWLDMLDSLELYTLGNSYGNPYNY